MKRFRQLFVLSAIGGLCLLAGRLSSQDKPGKPLARPGGSAAKTKEPIPPTEAQEESDEVARRWLAFRTPGAGHKRLEPLIGKWEYHQKLWTKADSPPHESSGTTEVRWTLGKRFIEIESSGTFLDLPFTGRWMLGYDNFKRKYVSCYADNLGTGLYPAEGSVGPGEQAITLIGRMDDWYTGEHDRAFTYVIRWLGKDAWTFEIIDLASAAKTMEVAYTKQKEK